MDDEALARTLDTGRATYWSRSRQEYWVKGETSGHVQQVHEIRLDCDGDTLLVRVDQTGVACHTGDRTCFDADLVLRPDGPEPRCRRSAPHVRPGRRTRPGAAGPARRWPATSAWVAGRRRRRRACRAARPGVRGRASRRWRSRWAWWCSPAGAWCSVTRRVVRRAMARARRCWSRSGSVATVRGPASRALPDQVLEAMRASGTPTRTLGAGLTERGLVWAAAARCVASVAATALAVAWCPAWPEMGSRYDAPGAAGPQTTSRRRSASTSTCGSRIDEGRDPTA